MLLVPPQQMGRPIYRNRSMKQSRLPTRAVVGKSICLVDFHQHFKNVRASDGWSAEDGATVPQGRSGFKFDGNTLPNYEAVVLRNKFPAGWPGIKRIYFPAVFNGKVASAFSREGYEVFATDISPYWANNARNLGLRADVRGFEDVPQSSEFDADILIVFEPHVVERYAKLFSLLRAFSAGIPVMMIDTVDYSERQYLLLGVPPLTPIALRTEYLIAIANRGCTRESFVDIQAKNGKLYRWDGYYPLYGMMRIGYDYGASYLDHVVYYDPHANQDSGERCIANVFRFSCLIPEPGTIRRAALDLQLLDAFPELVIHNSLSVNALAEQFGCRAEEIAASLFRLIKLQIEQVPYAEKFFRLITE